MAQDSFHASSIDRRQFFGITAAAAGYAAAECAAAPPVEAEETLGTIRVGFVGIGVKGWQHVRNLMHIPGVELVAIGDVLDEPISKTKRYCKLLGLPEPTAYTRGENDFQRMCAEEDLDLVYTATPWRWHVPICLAAMESGKHAATEIPAALTLDDCWKLVETSENTNRHLSMMENVNYRREELAILRMIREGALGELIHAEAGYMHDTRYLKAREYGDGLWLGAHHAERNGNLYPTHGLGPMAWNFDLGRGNRMEYLVSMSSKARGMNLYAKEHLPEGHPYRERDYINGDVNSSLIKTTNGESILIKHDTDLPRPYSRINLVQGTRGIVRGFPSFQVSLEKTDLTPAVDLRGKDHEHEGPHEKYGWRSGKSIYDDYDHPLWTAMNEFAGSVPVGPDGFSVANALRSGDYTEDYRLIQALRQGVAPDFDVYDAADWSVVTALSEKSVANRSQAVDFPDFTKGKWKTRPRLEIMGV